MFSQCRPIFLLLLVVFFAGVAADVDAECGATGVDGSDRADNSGVDGPGVAAAVAAVLVAGVAVVGTAAGAGAGAAAGAATDVDGADVASVAVAGAGADDDAPAGGAAAGAAHAWCAVSGLQSNPVGVSDATLTEANVAAVKKLVAITDSYRRVRPARLAVGSKYSLPVTVARN